MPQHMMKSPDPVEFSRTFSTELQSRAYRRQREDEDPDEDQAQQRSSDFAQLLLQLRSP
jgi:hypothetical protein